MSYGGESGSQMSMLGGDMVILGQGDGHPEGGVILSWEVVTLGGEVVTWGEEVVTLRGGCLS